MMFILLHWRELCCITKDGIYSDLLGCILPLHLILTEHYLKAPSDGEERKESPPQLSRGGGGSAGL